MPFAWHRPQAGVHLENNVYTNSVLEAVQFPAPFMLATAMNPCKLLESVSMNWEWKLMSQDTYKMPEPVFWGRKGQQSVEISN
jgi:hypothetical protein